MYSVVDYHLQETVLGGLEAQDAEQRQRGDWNRSHVGVAVCSRRLWTHLRTGHFRRRRLRQLLEEQRFHDQGAAFQPSCFRLQIRTFHRSHVQQRVRRICPTTFRFVVFSSFDRLTGSGVVAAFMHAIIVINSFFESCSRFVTNNMVHTYRTLCMIAWNVIWYRMINDTIQSLFECVYSRVQLFC